MAELSSIYVKTAQGDDAVQQRTRLVQRNLRTVLIVVDGHSSVAELIEKVGNEEMVLSALEQLERDGYIERSLGGPSQAPAFAPPEALSVPSVSPFAFPPQVSEAPAEPATASAAVEPVAAEEQGARQSPPAKSSEAEPAVDDDPFLTPGKIRKAQKEAALPTTKNEKKPGALGGLLKRMEAAPKAPPDQFEEPAVLASIRRGPKRSAASIATFVLGGLVAIITLLIFAFPYGIYRADIERALGTALGQTVKVAAVRAAFSPAPTLILAGVDIGTGLAIKEVRATPEIGSLFGAQKRFSKVVIAGASIDAVQLLGMIPSTGRLARRDDFLVRTLSFSAIDLKLHDLELKDWSGEFPLAAGGDAALLLRNSPGSLTLEIKPAADALNVLIEGRNWIPVDGAPFVWDFLTAQGEIRGNSVTLRKIDGRMFDGIVQGQALAMWAPAGVSLRAELGIEHAPARRVTAAFGPGISLDGDLNARLHFVAAGAGWLKAREDLRVEGDVAVRRGSLIGLDFADALRRGGQRGGTTNFDQMTGSLLLDGAALRLNAIEIVSGAMRATGSAAVATDSRQLSGNLDVRLRGAGVDVRMPVTLSGTLKDPKILGGRR